MNRGKGIVLKDDARLGKIGDQLVHVGLRLLAVGALEVSELDEFEILGRRAPIGAVGSLLQHGAIIGKGIFAEGNNLVAGDDVLAVGQWRRMRRR